MKRALPYLVIFSNALLLVLVIFHDHIKLPTLLQATGRIHPLVLHLPIGLVLIAALVWFRRNALGEQTVSRILPTVFGLNALFSVIAALAGVALSTEEGYEGEILYRHMNLGTVLSILTALQFFWYISGKMREIGFSILTAISIAAVVWTGHLGSVITHGEGFLTERFFPSTDEEQTGPTDSATVFNAAVLPVLNRKCNSCHNPGKKKGELIMTTLEGIAAGGENGAIWVAGKPEESSLIKRIRLPLDHDDHMPPDGKPQLTRSETRLLELFIRSGADGRQLLGALPKEDSLYLLAHTEMERSGSITASTPMRPFDFADADDIRKLNDPFRSVTQLAGNDPAIRVAFHLPSGFSLAAVTGLEPVAENITEINLTGMPVDIKFVEALREFPHLQKLILNNTGITDETATALSTLPSLNTLSVAGTKLTTGGMKSLGKSKTLRRVYLWGTGISEDDLNRLRKDLESIQWEDGFRPDADEILKLTPPLLMNENRILANGEPIRLKHNLPGVEIRYSLDVAVKPDSVTGSIYQRPLKATVFTVVQARAVKQGWISSNLARFQFFTAGTKPKSATLKSAPSPDYRANGAASLIDGRGGEADNHRDGQWVGYHYGPLVAEFDMGKPMAIGQVAVSYLRNIGAYIMPPRSVELQAADEPGQWKKMATITPEQPVKYDDNRVEAATINANATHRYWKLVVSPVERLPKWHSGKGEKGWIMVDEVFFHPKSKP